MLEGRVLSARVVVLIPLSRLYYTPIDDSAVKSTIMFQTLVGRGFTRYIGLRTVPE